MNYFEPVTKYYIINLFDRYKDNILLGNISLSNYVKENFPILNTLEQERVDMLNKEVRKDSEQYIKHCLLISYAYNYLNLPQYLLGRGDDSIIATEPVTNTKIYSDGLKYRRVSDLELGEYYMSDYEERVNNFFNPSKETKRRANLTKDELINEKRKNTFARRVKIYEKTRKGRK